MSRKFVLAMMIVVFGAVALGIGWLTGGEFVALASIVMGAYGAANVLQPRFERYDPSDSLED
jgi:hypothetical protein